MLRRDGFVVRVGGCAGGDTCGLELTFHFCRYERPAGLLVTLFVHIVYMIALKFEGYVVPPYIVALFADDTKTVHRHDLRHTFNVG